MTDVLQHALEYLRHGWPVIPARGKQPVESWAIHQRKLPTTDQVREWFSLSQEYNLAVITGRLAGLVVVDCDSKHDSQWWQATFPATPLVVATGGGGAHCYYRYPQDMVRNRSRLFGRAIDLRAEGGLVIAPPSIHPETGRAYQWKDGFPCRIEKVPVFEVEWIADCERRSPIRRSYSCRHEAMIRNGVAYIGRIKAVAGNGGHNATFRAACKLRDSGLTAAEALDAMLAWNETNASPSWSPKELGHKVDDAYRQS